MRDVRGRAARVTRAVAWLREQLAFVLVLAGIVLGLLLLLAFPDHWKPGTVVIALTLLAAGLVRACVPSGAVGFLAVRARWIDTVLYLVVGGLILAVDIRLQG